MNHIYVKTLGCKVNTFDAHAIENKFKDLGWTLVDSPLSADVSVVNTCSVTQNADREARYLARKFKRDNPDTFVVMTGCYAQTDSAKLAELADVDVIVPNEAKDEITNFVIEQFEAKKIGIEFKKFPESIDLVRENKQGHFKSSLTFFDQADSTQTRAFVKIQDGCNGFCSYCLIPYARGASRSVPEAIALAEIQRLVKIGTKEIVLTGIHIGDYGVDFLEEDSSDQLIENAATESEPFVEFVKKVFAIEGLKRLRISSLEPAELTLGLIKVLHENKDKFCDHFHLPLQSGHDDILKKMRRKYDSARYKESCEMARKYFPDCCIGADAIPGFPGETEDHFDATINFIKECGINYLHVFPYSARPNTAALKMPGHLPQEIVKRRAATLRDLSDVLKHEYQSRFIGRDLEILWEKDFDELNRPVGISRNYINLVAFEKGFDFAPGSVSSMKIRGFSSGRGGRMLGTSSMSASHRELVH